MFPPPPTPCSLPQYAIHFLVVCLALPQASPHCFQVVFVPRCVCTSAVSVTLGREDPISPTSSPSHLVPLPPPGNNCLSRPSPLLLPSCVRPAPCRLQLSARLWTVTLGSEDTISPRFGLSLVRGHDFRCLGARILPTRSNLCRPRPLLHLSLPSVPR